MTTLRLEPGAMAGTWRVGQVRRLRDRQFRGMTQRIRDLRAGQSPPDRIVFRVPQSRTARMSSRTIHVLANQIGRRVAIRTSPSGKTCTVYLRQDADRLGI